MQLRPCSNNPKSTKTSRQARLLHSCPRPLREDVSIGNTRSNSGMFAFSANMTAKAADLRPHQRTSHRDLTPRAARLCSSSSSVSLRAGTSWSSVRVPWAQNQSKLPRTTLGREMSESGGNLPSSTFSFRLALRAETLTERHRFLNLAGGESGHFETVCETAHSINSEAVSCIYFISSSFLRKRSDP